MGLVPVYRPAVGKLLDELEIGENEKLWNAIVDTLTMICDNTDDGTGKAYRIRNHRGDKAFWAVRVPCDEPADWYVLWDEEFDKEEDAQAAIFYFIGALPHGTVRG